MCACTLSRVFPDEGVGGGNVLCGAVKRIEISKSHVFGTNKKKRTACLPSFVALLSLAVERLKRLPLWCTRVGDSSIYISTKH